MAQQLPPSEGDRFAPHVRVRVSTKRLRPSVFKALFKAVELLGLVLKIINETKDLPRN